MVTIAKNTIVHKVAKNINLKSSHHREKDFCELCMVMGVNMTYCGDYFTIFTNTESLCCAPDTNIMLHVNYISV